MNHNKHDFIEMKTMCVRVYPDQRAFAETYAWEHRMTLSAVIRKALNEMIDAEKAQSQFIETLRDEQRQKLKEMNYDDIGLQ